MVSLLTKTYMLFKVVFENKYLTTYPLAPVFRTLLIKVTDPSF